jgi:PKD domain
MPRTLLVLILLSSVACGSTGGSPTNPTGSTLTPSTGQANRAPVVTSMTVSAGFAVAQLTTVSYAASATDADGDSLTYTWDFGDGTSATGAEVVHTYRNVFGLRSTRLTVSDARGGSASDTRHVTVGILAGHGRARPARWEVHTGRSRCFCLRVSTGRQRAAASSRGRGTSNGSWRIWIRPRRIASMGTDVSSCAARSTGTSMTSGSKAPWAMTPATRLGASCSALVSTGT